MRLTIMIEDVTVELEDDTTAPSFDTIETLFNRAVDAAVRCYWEINGDFDIEAEPTPIDVEADNA